VIGIDLSKVMLDRASANAERAGLRSIELRQGAIEELPVESESVDWVISNCVINLSSDKARVFAEIHRVLRPGGRLVVSDMIAEGLPDWIAADPDLRSACISGAISEHEYLVAVRAAGLVDVDVIDRFSYDDSQIRALIDELLPASLASVAGASGPSRETMLNDVIAATHGRVQSLRIKARRP
jgi:SAM-dependent methyltransferase